MWLNVVQNKGQLLHLSCLPVWAREWWHILPWWMVSRGGTRGMELSGTRMVSRDGSECFLQWERLLVAQASLLAFCRLVSAQTGHCTCCSDVLRWNVTLQPQWARRETVEADCNGYTLNSFLTPPPMQHKSKGPSGSSSLLSLLLQCSLLPAVSGIAAGLEIYLLIDMGILL